MEALHNYIDSLIFHFNEMNMVIYKALGLQFHYTTGWEFLFNCVAMFVLMYLYGRSNLPEVIYKYDSNMTYTVIFIGTFFVGLIYIFDGLKSILLLLCIIITLVAFYMIVLRNKKYMWLKELLMRMI